MKKIKNIGYILIIINNNKEIDFYGFEKKCNILKKRTKNINFNFNKKIYFKN